MPNELNWWTGTKFYQNILSLLFEENEIDRCFINLGIYLLNKDS